MVENIIKTDFAEIVYDRNSIRVYDEKVKINQEEMHEIIKKATKAPSAVNIINCKLK